MIVCCVCMFFIRCIVLWGRLCLLLVMRLFFLILKFWRFCFCWRIVCELLLIVLEFWSLEILILNFGKERWILGGRIYGYGWCFVFMFCSLVVVCCFCRWFLILLNVFSVWFRSCFWWRSRVWIVIWLWVERRWFCLVIIFCRILRLFLWRKC